MKKLLKKIKTSDIKKAVVVLSLVAALLSAISGDFRLMAWQLMTAFYLWMLVKADKLIDRLIVSNQKSLDLCDEMMKAIEQSFLKSAKGKSPALDQFIDREIPKA